MWGLRRKLPVIVASVLFTVAPVSGRELRSYAFVEDDASLTIDNRRVRLYGIHIPDTGAGCRTYTRPVTCAPRAALALDFKIQGFVNCDILADNPDGTLTGRCRYKNEDLSAYLLRQGLALSLPDAPFEYRALERIARHRGAGLWSRP